MPSNELPWARTAGAIPAVGNAVNAVTELILAGALLVKNCLGAMAVVVLLLAGAGPVIHYGLLSLSFRSLVQWHSLYQTNES